MKIKTLTLMAVLTMASSSFGNLALEFDLSPSAANNFGSGYTVLTPTVTNGVSFQNIMTTQTDPMTGVDVNITFSIASTGGGTSALTSGLGVDGGGSVLMNENTNPNVDEQLRFNVNVAPVNPLDTATFDGFSFVRLAAFSDPDGAGPGAPDQAIISAGGVPVTVDASLVGPPANFYVLGAPVPGELSVTQQIGSFLVGSVGFDISTAAAAIPEPSSFLALSMVGLICFGVRRRSALLQLED